jgi:FecR protein
MSHSPEPPAPDCSRTWEVLAIHDGRLAGSSVESMDRHVAGCGDCRRERAALEALSRAARELPEPPALGELERRRLRSRLLQRANDELVVRAPRRARWLATAAIAAAVTALAGAGAMRANRPAPLAPPQFEIANVQDAAWRSEAAGPDARPVLSNGKATVHVHPLKPGQRFLLQVPDGEIEVHGTRFVVEIVHDRTSSVEVTEGVVALRLVGDSERLLRAGERWVANPTAPVALAPVALAPAAPPRPSDPPTDPPNPLVSTRSADPPATPMAPAAMPPRAVSTPVSLPVSSPASPARGSQGAEFATAMKAFSSGSYSDADARFTAFAAAYPGDPRSEDASFLRAVSRSRMGDPAGAAAGAKAYLAAYPNGLRRQEALLMASGR